MSSQFHSLRQRVAKALYEEPPLHSNHAPVSRIPWNDLDGERKAAWLADADRVIPMVIEACARIADQKDPEKPANYLFPRERIGSAMKGLFVGHPDEDGVWECPIAHPNCFENCGSYACGN